MQPETVAAYLVPRVRTVVARKAMFTYIKYLTIPRALVKFMSAPTKANKYFNKQGRHVPGHASNTASVASASVPNTAYSYRVAHVGVYCSFGQPADWHA